MAKKAKRSFVIVGDGRQYPIHPNEVYADTHPLVTEYSDRFEDIVERTASTLGTPANVTASNATATTADLTWDAVALATSYEVTTSPATETYVVTGTEVELTGLTASTSYDANVVAKNGSPHYADSAAGTDSFSTTA